MKEISKDSNPFSGDNTYNFTTPCYSKIIDIFIQDNLLHIIFEFDRDHIDRPKKIIMLDIKNISHTYGNLIPRHDYNYFKTILKTSIAVTSSSNGSGNLISSNMNFSLVEERFLVYINELLPVEEKRNNIIEEIIG